MDSVLEMEQIGGALPTPSGAMTSLLDDVGDDSYRYQYWRKPDGDVVVGPSWAVESERYRDEGWEPLKRYGKFLLNDPVINRQGKVVGSWRVNTEPFRQILQNGGAREFSVHEILEHGWHRKPPYRGVTFPQLAGIEHEDVTCAHCGKPFLSTADLSRHEAIVHSQTSQQDALARSLAGAMAGNSTNQAVVDVLQMMLKRMEAQEQRMADQAETIARLLASATSAVDRSPEKKAH